MLIRLEVQTDDFMDEAIVDGLNRKCPDPNILFSVLPYEDMSGVAVEIHLIDPVPMEQVSKAMVAFFTTLEQMYEE